ncbi:maleylpyruvate isomerase N-terminal domain-containing protein, partial [Streptomyces sp. SID3343]|uniref:maleylpyruvate isomerase N-terminal domain-containing protein n=1 Tax=Streptomyces sp. SID3343 TaxID=2690260 RepID=UPI0013C20245
MSAAVATWPVPHASARAWLREGTRVFADRVAELPEDAFGGPSALPGWSRAQLVAHVARNADALANLAAWARTGVETPMYADARERE